MLMCRIPLEGKMAVIQLPESVIPTICDIAYDFERWAQWDKLECWLKIVWLASPELSSEQWDWIKEVTLTSVRRQPALSMDFRECIAVTKSAYLENKFGTSAKLESVVIRLEGLGRLLDAEYTQKGGDDGGAR